MRKQRPSTIYVSGETVEHARKIEQATGIKASRLFQEFVTRYARSLQDGHAHSVKSLAFLLPGMMPSEIYAPRPFFEHSDHQVPGTDIWADAFREGQSPAYRVFLMGKTLANPILNHEDLWVDFLSRGGILQVLLQGDISGGTEDLPRLWATANKARCYEKAHVRKRTVESLSRMAVATETPHLEVRNSGQTLLTTNSSLIFREDGTLDIYISFNFAESSGSRSVVILTTATHKPPDETCELVAKPYERLWLASIPEPGFEESNGSVKMTTPTRRKGGRTKP
ncbi:MAG: hypothetical protein WD208_13705 [Dehalococcoidia bacterium]